MIAIHTMHIFIHLEFKIRLRSWRLVSLLLKDLTDSDPEPSTVERVGAGPGSGFKWEHSVSEPSFTQICFALQYFLLTVYL